MLVIHRYIGIFLALLITALFLASSLVIDRSLFSGLNMVKTLWVRFVACGAVLFVAEIFWRIKSIAITVVDMLLLAFVSWLLLCEGFSQMPYANFKEVAINCFVYGGIYLFFRINSQRDSLKRRQSASQVIKEIKEELEKMKTELENI